MITKKTKLICAVLLLNMIFFIHAKEIKKNIYRTGTWSGTWKENNKSFDVKMNLQDHNKITITIIPQKAKKGTKGIKVSGYFKQDGTFEASGKDFSKGLFYEYTGNSVCITKYKTLNIFGSKTCQKKETFFEATLKQ